MGQLQDAVDAAGLRQQSLDEAGAKLAAGQIPGEASWLRPLVEQGELQKAGVSSAQLYDQIYRDPLMHAAFMAGKYATDYKGIEGAIRYVIERLGLNPDDQHFARTPERVTKVLRAYVQPINLEEVLSGGFADDDPQADDDRSEKTLVVQTAIPFMGLCAHHLLPFFGAAAVGYVPRDRVVGLSKLARLVYAAGHVAPTTQEHITNLVADTLYHSKTIEPRGVAVLTSGLHGCMAIRGVETPGTKTITSAIRGAAFAENPALETKFMTLAMEGLK